MDRERLIQAASRLKAPSREAGKEFEALRETLADELARRMLAREDIDGLIGPDNVELMRDNGRNFMRFLGSLAEGYSPKVLVETVLWVFLTYRAHGFNLDYWPANLDTAGKIFRERLSPDCAADFLPFIDWLMEHIPDFAESSGKYPE